MIVSIKSQGKLVTIICLLILIVVKGLALPRTTSHLSRKLRTNVEKKLNNKIHRHRHFSAIEEDDINSSKSSIPLISGVGTKLRKYWRNGKDQLMWTKKDKVDAQKLGMTLALFSTYFTVMGAKCALPTTLSMLTSDLKFLPGQNPKNSMASVLSISTMAIAFGKIILGPVIDSFGGILCLKVALFLLSICLGTIGITDQFSIFAKSWICVDFIFSACWAACLHAIHQSFDPQEWASKIGTLATAARMGNAISFVTFASILEWTSSTIRANGIFNIKNSIKPWRAVFLLAGIVQIIPFILLTKFGGKNPKNKEMKDGIPKYKEIINDSENRLENKNKRILWTVLGKEMGKVEFWCHFVNRSVQMVIASFLLFVPSYMTNCFGMTPSSAASVGSIYALGCFISIFFGSKRYTNLPRTKRVLSTTVMTLSLLGVCVGNLGHTAGFYKLSPLMGSMSMLIWGLSFAIPFYIPASMYALRQGGRESSATIADIFDFGGFASLALFNGYVAGIQQNDPSSWATTYIILSFCSILSMISLALAILLDKTPNKNSTAISRAK